ncbi:hypothetical protein GF357_04585 [Candidatus Dojkabacteria bacterium]|nr:hypothetical protein [Candidatus Dojkabacteria bacterium]
MTNTWGNKSARVPVGCKDGYIPKGLSPQSTQGYCGGPVGHGGINYVEAPFVASPQFNQEKWQVDNL